MTVLSVNDVLRSTFGGRQTLHRPAMLCKTAKCTAALSSRMLSRRAVLMRPNHCIRPAVVWPHASTSMQLGMACNHPMFGGCNRRVPGGRGGAPVPIRDHARTSHIVGAISVNVTEQELYKMTVSQLQTECRNLGLPSTGRKAAIVDRLLLFAKKQKEMKQEQQEEAIIKQEEIDRQKVADQEEAAELRVEDVRAQTTLVLREWLGQRGVNTDGWKRAQLVQSAEQILKQGAQTAPSTPHLLNAAGGNTGNNTTSTAIQLDEAAILAQGAVGATAEDLITAEGDKGDPDADEFGKEFVDGDFQPYDLDALNDMSIAQLQEIAESHGLPSDGERDDLIAMLIDVAVDGGYDLEEDEELLKGLDIDDTEDLATTHGAEQGKQLVNGHATGTEAGDLNPLTQAAAAQTVSQQAPLDNDLPEWDSTVGVEGALRDDMERARDVQQSEQFELLSEANGLASKAEPLADADYEFAEDDQFAASNTLANMEVDRFGLPLVSGTVKGASARGQPHREAPTDLGIANGTVSTTDDNAVDSAKVGNNDEADDSDKRKGLPGAEALKAPTGPLAPAEQGDRRTLMAQEQGILTHLSNLDPSQMTVKEMRAELKTLGLAIYGVRVEVERRLREAIALALQGGLKALWATRPPSPQRAQVPPQQSAPATQKQLMDLSKETSTMIEAMSLRELQSSLRSRGLSEDGSRDQLQDRLQTALMDELVTEHGHVDASDAPAIAEVEQPAVNAITTLSTHPLDPPLNITLLCGPCSLPLARVAMDRLQYFPPPLTPQEEEGQGPPESPSDSLSARRVSVMVYYILPEGPAKGWHKIEVPWLYGFSAMDLQHKLATENSTAPVQLAELPQLLHEQHQDVVFPLLAPGDVFPSVQLAPFFESLARMGITITGVATDELSTVISRSRTLSTLEKCGFETTLFASYPRSIAADGEAVKSDLDQWLAEQKQIDPDTTRFVVQHDRTDVQGATVPLLAKGVDEVVLALAMLAPPEPLLLTGGQGTPTDPSMEPPADSVIADETTKATTPEGSKEEEEVFIEAMLPGTVRWVVGVVDTPQGPLALPPAEVEVVDVETECFEAELAHYTYDARVEGVHEDYIKNTIEAMRHAYVDELYSGHASFETAHTPLQHVRLYCPPRLPEDVGHGIRVAAAKAYKELGLRDAAVVRGVVHLTVERPRHPPEQEFPQPIPEPEESGGDGGVRLLGRMGKSPMLQVEDDGIPLEEELDLDTYKTPGESPYDKETEEFYESIEGGPGPRWPEGFPDAEFYAEVLDECPIIQHNQEPPEGWPDAQQEDTEPDKDRAQETDAKLTEALELIDLDLLGAEALCRLPGGTLYFSSVSPLIQLTPAESKYLLLQAAMVGMGPEDLLRNLVNNALARAGVPPPPPAEEDSRVTQLAGPSGKVTADGRTLHQLPALQPLDVYKSSLLPSPVASDEMQAILDFLAPEDDLGPWGEDVEELETEAITSAFIDQAYREPGAQLRGVTSNSYIGADGEETLGFDPYDPIGYPEGWNTEDSSNAAGGAGPGPEEPQGEGPHRVWVLVGGEGKAGDISLATGRTVWSQLHHQPGLQVEVFVLAPLSWNQNELDRRREMLERHYEMMQIQTPPSMLPEELTLPHIRNPPLPEATLISRAVWVVPPHLLLRDSLIDLHLAAEDALLTENFTHRLKDPLKRASELVLQRTQQEFALTDLPGVARMWGGEAEDVAPPPRYIDMDQFILEAKALKAVVFVATQEDSCNNGQLAMLLEESGIPFTGSTWQTVQICNDLTSTAEELLELESAGINVAPQHQLAVSELLSTATAIRNHPIDPEANPHPFQGLWDQLRGAAGATGALAARAPKGVGLGDGLTLRLAEPHDLYTLAIALIGRWPSVPLSEIPDQPFEATLPVHQPSHFILEPFIESDVVVVPGTPPGEVQLELRGLGRWVEVACYVIGEQGRMAALTPSLLAREPNAPSSLDDPLQADLQWGARGGTNVICVTPPPQHIVQPAAIEGAKQRIEMVADKLGLAGWARIDAFLHGESGELVVTGVQATPPFSPNAPVLQQIVSHDPEPILPSRFLMELIHLALIRPTTASTSFGMSNGAETYGEEDYNEEDLDVGPEDEADIDPDWGNEWPAASQSAAVS